MLFRPKQVLQRREHEDENEFACEEENSGSCEEEVAAEKIGGEEEYYCIWLASICFGCPKFVSLSIFFQMVVVSDLSVSRFFSVMWSHVIRLCSICLFVDMQYSFLVCNLV